MVLPLILVLNARLVSMLLGMHGVMRIKGQSLQLRRALQSEHGVVENILKTTAVSQLGDKL